MKLALRAGLLAGSLLPGCRPGPETEVGAVRVGECGAHVRYGGVSRVALADRGGQIALEIPPGPRGTLEIAAAIPAAATSAPNVECRATFTSATADTPVSHELALTARDVWTEAAFDIPAPAKGASLRLACEDASVIWAQPLLVPSPEGGREPLFVVLSLDTLRADHVEGFGTPPVPTPTLGTLVEDGVAFTAAVSPYTWTMPSHYALFYSRLYGFPLDVPPSAGIARRLADAGYATAAFNGGGFVSANFGFDLGFDRYVEYDATKAGKSDIDLLPGLLSDAGRWIDAHAGVPSFLFLHTYAVHEPPPAEQKMLAARPVLAPYDLSAEEMAVARDFYARLVGRVDAALAPFVGKLREVAKTRPTLLVVLSDHGEAFHEHGNVRHGISGPLVTLHDEVVRIPVIFWAPGIVSAREPATYPFSLLDVAPTLLSAAGLASTGMTGRDFWPLLRGTGNERSEAERLRWNAPVVSYKNPGWGAPASWSSRTPERKRIVQRRPIAGTSTLETYDLLADPRERTNLTEVDDAESIATATRALKKEAQQLAVVFPEADPALPVCRACGIDDPSPMHAIPDPCSGGQGGQAPLDPATRERLKALGYLQ